MIALGALLEMEKTLQEYKKQLPNYSQPLVADAEEAKTEAKTAYPREEVRDEPAAPSHLLLPADNSKSEVEKEVKNKSAVFQVSLPPVGDSKAKTKINITYSLASFGHFKENKKLNDAKEQLKTESKLVLFSKPKLYKKLKAPKELLETVRWWKTQFEKFGLLDKNKQGAADDVTRYALLGVMFFGAQILREEYRLYNDERLACAMIGHLRTNLGHNIGLWSQAPYLEVQTAFNEFAGMIENATTDTKGKPRDLLYEGAFTEPSGPLLRALMQEQVFIPSYLNSAQLQEQLAEQEEAAALESQSEVRDIYGMAKLFISAQDQLLSQHTRRGKNDPVRSKLTDARHKDAFDLLDSFRIEDEGWDLGASFLC